MLPRRNDTYARGLQGAGMDLHRVDRYLGCLRSILSLRSERLEIYQRIFISKPLWFGAIRTFDDEPDSDDRSYPSDAISRIDDSFVLRTYRYDLWSDTYS